MILYLFLYPCIRYVYANTGEIVSPDLQQQLWIKAKLYTPSTLNIQMKLILLWVWAERAVLGRAKTALKFKYEIEIG